jgi:hypothetical protein
MRTLKIYNRLDGVPYDHEWILVQILSYADQGGSPYIDKILASSEKREELESYCHLNKISIPEDGQPVGWAEYRIHERKQVRP